MYEYLSIVNNLDGSSVQIGDFGYGFAWDKVYPPANLDMKHRIFAGNYDSPSKALEHPNFLGRFGYIKKPDVFYVGGEYSIDKAVRTPGKSWWADEELSVREMDECLELYCKIKPSIVASHGCPQSIVDRVMETAYILGVAMTNRPTYYSSTSKLLQRMYEIHEPEVWVFGHYHVGWQGVVGSTYFKCLAPLEVYQVRTRDEIVPKEQLQ